MQREMYKQLAACLLYLILELQRNVGIVAAAQDEDVPAQPLTIYVDAGEEVETLLKSMNLYASKQDDFEKMLLRVQTLMESMDERLVKLESDYEITADSKQKEQSSITALESRLTDIENTLDSTKGREMSIQLLMEKLNEMEKMLKFSQSARIVEGKQFDVHYAPPRINMPTTYTDCADVKMKLGDRYKDGVYEINVAHFPPWEVRCVTKCLAGSCCAWTVIMHGSAASAERVFQRDWNEYQNGFGNAHGDLFIGLDRLHALTNRSPQLMLITDYVFGKEYIFEDFRIANAIFSYAVTIPMDLEKIPGGLNDLILSTTWKFSTNSKCAMLHGRSWWYNDQCVGGFRRDTLSDNICMMIRPEQCNGN
ncbi:angiopoietin-4 isoform X2 [Ceratitis capitata]|uniref:angiopoietin-4 isoform X2 n=1 Tax=Ceratitis capitata TaxID=7213 RepID=UPI000A11A960|nr:angiopoietin-4 isoform X2 [Ceratitis capitata]